ncbi:hypothetical protein [Marinobacter caseinilyticus]|uniref:hypothetical protein n=1 Tax=Marinobacter caseinilyticus TaxID=2692195 RepID=UPI00140D3B7A|nr:hypothetical protein [Marinobacter caseinilyticus]
MIRVMQLTGVALIGLALTGCFDGNSNRSARPDLPTDFTAFVTSEISNTADNRNAVGINDLEFGFNDQTNEQAFNGLF